VKRITLFTHPGLLRIITEIQPFISLMAILPDSFMGIEWLNEVNIGT